jgi:D-hexose-6-phosphate mutarotase
MTEQEGTGCWMVVDIRLHPRPVAHEYAGGVRAEDVHSRFKPESEEEAQAAKAMLREYEERSDGELVWCAYTNLVRGEQGVKGYIPVAYDNFHPSVYHSRVSAWAKLRALKEFWEQHEGTVAEAKIQNPHVQPTESVVMQRVHFARFVKKHDLEDREINSPTGPAAGFLG